MSDDALQEPQPDQQRPWHGSDWAKLAFVAAGIFVLLCVILYIPIRATSTASYCGSCHPMKEAYASWHRSAHHSVPCVKCHVPQGLASSLKWRLKEGRNIWAEYLNMDPIKQQEPRPASENCIKCHPLKSLMGIPGKLRMPHATHVNQNNLTCIDCHTDVAHAPKGASTAVSMSPCTMCHQQTNDPKRCSFCHYTPPVTGKSHPTDFIKAHGELALADPTNCYRCHHNKVQFCDACHAKPTPGHYTADWRSAHGKQALKDRDRCLGCHTYESLCKQCHEVNHPADWGVSHAPVAAKGDASCMVCHPRQMCVDCHTKKGVTAP